MKTATTHEETTRNAIHVVSGFLSAKQLRRLADAAEQIQLANAHWGLNSQVKANHDKSLEVDAIIAELGEYYVKEIAEKLNR